MQFFNLMTLPEGDAFASHSLLVLVTYMFFYCMKWEQPPQKNIFKEHKFPVLQNNKSIKEIGGII